MPARRNQTVVTRKNNKHYINKYACKTGISNLALLTISFLPNLSGPVDSSSDL